MLAEGLEVTISLRSLKDVGYHGIILRTWRHWSSHFRHLQWQVFIISNDNLRSITQLISRLTVWRGTWLPLPSIPKLEAGVSWESPPTHFITHKNTGKNCSLVGKICYGRLFTCIYVTRIEILQSKASPGLAFTRLCICMYNLEKSKQTQTVRLI